MHSIGPVYIHAQSALAGSAKQFNEAQGSLYNYCVKCYKKEAFAYCNACRRAREEAL